MTELSKRLQAVADLVTPGLRVADVGCDHGYLPICLVQQGIAPSAIAMDVNRGPLERAREHIQGCGLTERIDTRLSDGLANLKIEEADCVIAAGMGGGLAIRILSEGREKARAMKELILQPQSEIPRVRRYLCENGYRIAAEDMVLEEGKYYPMMRAVPGETPAEAYTREDYEYGPLLLRGAHPVLREFLQREIRMTEEILAGLDALDMQGESSQPLSRGKDDGGMDALDMQAESSQSLSRGKVDRGLDARDAQAEAITSMSCGKADGGLDARAESDGGKRRREGQPNPRIQERKRELAHKIERVRLLLEQYYGQEELHTCCAETF